MRLVSFVPPDAPSRAGLLLGATVLDLAIAAPLVFEEAEGLQWDMRSLLQGDQEQVSLESAAMIAAAVTSIVGDGEALVPDAIAGGMMIGGSQLLLPLAQVRLRAPLPHPTSLREFEAFEQHALALRRYANETLPAQWYRRPAFFFANHQAIIGPDEEVVLPAGNEFDMGIGVACVIGRTVSGLEPVAAHAAIAGYILINSWCARDEEAHLRPLGLGPAAARFATSLGPALVTPDELEIYTDDDGRLNLALTLTVNGIRRVQTNTALATYSFPELIAAASRFTTLIPGDIIATGPCDGGSLLMLNGPNGPWLEPDAVIEVSATGLGILRNRIGNES